LVISSSSSSKHDGSIPKEGIAALLSLWSKGDASCAAAVVAARM